MASLQAQAAIFGVISFLSPLSMAEIVTPSYLLLQQNEDALMTHGLMAVRNFKWRVARTYAADALLQVRHVRMQEFQQ